MLGAKWIMFCSPQPKGSRRRLLRWFRVGPMTSPGGKENRAGPQAGLNWRPGCTQDGVPRGGLWPHTSSPPSDGRRCLWAWTMPCAHVAHRVPWLWPPPAGTLPHASLSALQSQLGVLSLPLFMMLSARFFLAFKTGTFKAIRFPLSTTLVASHTLTGQSRHCASVLNIFFF